MTKTGSGAAHLIWHRVFTVIGVILCAVLLPMLIINCILIVKQYTDPDTVPSVGGIFPMIVLTDSMQGTFDSGSLVICKSEAPEKIQTGDIICFYDPSGSSTSTTIHRVMEIETDASGSLSFVTKGDANNTEDATPVPADKLIGVYKFHVAKLGSLALFMQTTQGMLLFVALPVLLLVGYDMLRRQRDEKQKDRDLDAMKAELEALRAEKSAK